MKFNENRSKGSGDMEWTQMVTDGMTDVYKKILVEYFPCSKK